MVRPSFAHSSKRLSACVAGRSFPVRPSSPNAARPGLTGAFLAAEDGDDHGQALRVDAGGDPAGHGEIGLRDERLDLQEQRSRPLERAGDGRSDLAVATAEQLRRVGDADQTCAGHLEDAELVRRAEAVLGGAEDAVGAVAVALELKDAVDEMLEDSGPGDGTVLRHVADEEDGDAGLLGDSQEAGGCFPDLSDRAGRLGA